MTIEERVKKAVTDFVRAGDTNNEAQLHYILHDRFQNVQDGFFNEKGVFVFSKEDYKSLVGSKRFGGSARTIEFGQCEISGNIAQVQARLESEVLIFNSRLLLCRVEDEWKVLLNVPIVQVK